MNKTDFLQIRITPNQKKRIQMLAKRDKMDVTTWVMSKLLGSKSGQFQTMVHQIQADKNTHEGWAQVHDFLVHLSEDEFDLVVSDIPDSFLGTLEGNYIAAMVEEAAAHKNILHPDWTKKYTGMDEPYFGSNMASLRMHLLLSSPIPFRRRNIFIDASVGERV